MRGLLRAVGEALDGPVPREWQAAIKATPRHRFLPERIWLENDEGGYEPCDLSTDHDRWFEAAYQDTPIVTQINDGQASAAPADAWPSSSASAPSIVVRMLRDLDVRPGMNVLEIGTGTGWNAALLSQRVGSDEVFTIEVDGDTAAEARHRLARAGYSPTLVIGDGADGHPEAAPFDRVIATCSVRRIPYAWVAQSRPGAVIVAPWGPEYGGEAVARLVVGDDGTAGGRFVGSSAFMRLRQQRTARPGSPEYLSGPWPADGAKSSTPLSPEALADWPAMFAVGVQVPGAFPLTERYADGTYTLWLHDTAVTSWATADWEPGRTAYEVVQSGPRSLWNEVETA